MHFAKRETRGGTVLSGTVLLARGCEFDSQRDIWNFSFSGRTVDLGSTQSVTAMSTTRIFWEHKWMVSKADNAVTFKCRNSGSLSFLQPSWNTKVCTGVALTCFILLKQNPHASVQRRNL